MNNFSRGWHVLYTKPKQEKKVFNLLHNYLEDTYLPLKRELRQWSDRKKWLETPLFPSYIFVYLNDLHEYELGVDGACWYVNFSGKIVQIADHEIERIKYMLGNFSKVDVAPLSFRAGESRKINFGPLTGYDCEIIRWDGKDRILVRIDSLEQSLIAEVDVKCLVDLTRD